jgi:hypothetical protein
VRKHTALHDAKLRLAGIRHGDAGHQVVAEGEEPIASAARPAERALHRLPRRRLVGRVRQALVEHHGDV